MYVLAEQSNGQLQRQSMYKETTSKYNQDKQSRIKEWNKENIVQLISVKIKVEKKYYVWCTE